MLLQKFTTISIIEIHSNTDDICMLINGRPLIFIEKLDSSENSDDSFADKEPKRRRMRFSRHGQEDEKKTSLDTRVSIVNGSSTCLQTLHENDSGRRCTSEQG